MTAPLKPTVPAQFHAHPTPAARPAPTPTTSVCIAELGTYGEAATNADSVPASQANPSMQPKTDHSRLPMVPSALLAPKSPDAKPAIAVTVPVSTAEPGTPGTQVPRNVRSALTPKVSKQTRPTRSWVSPQAQKKPVPSSATQAVTCALAQRANASTAKLATSGKAPQTDLASFAPAS